MRGVAWAGAALFAAGLAGLVAFASLRAAISFAVGALLSWVNLVLLEQGVTAALMKSPNAGSSSAVLRFLLRYGVFGLVLYGMIGARLLDVLPATVGLSLFVFAIIVKGLTDAARDLFGGDGRTLGPPRN
ncbi:MAG: ATP synthase subunit I [Acidobacteriota bacterium]